VRIAFAADHRGYKLKEALKAAVAADHDVVDFGTDKEASCDYVDYGRRAAEAVATGQVDRGVLICATGVGMSILANKIPGCRAALCWTAYMARLTRLHNDSNILVLSGDQTAAPYAREILATWLASPYEGGRHQRRLDKIRDIEVDYAK